MTRLRAILLGSGLAIIALFLAPAFAQTCTAGSACNASSVNKIFYVDGIANTSVAAALSACPPAGCVIDATGSGNLNLGTFDPGTKEVTLRLGPYIYQLQQIVLRPGLQIFGMSSSNAGTVLQSTNSSVSPFVLPTNQPAYGVHLRGFMLLGVVGNTNQTAFFMDATQATPGGLWQSTVENINIQRFAGVGIYLKGSTNLNVNQFNEFRNVIVLRGGSGEALRIEGANGQLLFAGGELDGPTIGNGTNMYIGNPTGAVNPYSIKFAGTTSQNANLGILFQGADAIDVDSMHFENLSRGMLFALGGSQNSAIEIHNSLFGNVGRAGGSGYLLNTELSGAALNLIFRSNFIATMPDRWIVPASGGTGQGVRWTDNSSPYPSATADFKFGSTLQTSPVGTVLTTNKARVVAVNTPPGGTTVSSIKSTLGPGEMITLYNVGTGAGGILTIAAPCCGGSGSISTGLAGTLSLGSGDSATFVREDLIPGFRLVSRSR